MTHESSDLRRRIGRHHYVEVADDNPEKRGQTHLTLATSTGRCREQ